LEVGSRLTYSEAVEKVQSTYFQRFRT